MANIDNSCSNLEINNLYENTKDVLGDIYNLQANTQKNVYHYDFLNMNMRDLMNFWHMNNHALIDELLETLDALGGIKNGVGADFWKGKLSATILNNEDELELKFELIDQLHFIMNMFVSINGTAEELNILYKENDNIQRKLLTHTDHLLFGINLIEKIHIATDKLGGYSKTTGGNSIWKRWKQKYFTYSNIKFSDLSLNEQLECKKAIIDVLYLFIEYSYNIGMTEKEMYNMYMSKNIENIRRQNEGY